MNVGSPEVMPLPLDLVETGGTIDMEGFDSRHPVGSTSKLVKAVEHFAPNVQVHRPLDVHLDSSNIGPAEWKKILSKVIALCEKRAGWGAAGGGPVPGIVLTHGTDVLQETALVLALELAERELSFPVVFTCAFAPPSEANSDALRNLVLAAAAALSYRLGTDGAHQIPPGVYVVVGNDLHLASRIKKITTRPLNLRSYVESYPAPVGRLTIAQKANLWQLDIDNEVRIRVHRDLYSPRRNERGTRPAGGLDFGYVEHLWFKKDSPPEILERALGRCQVQAAQKRGRVALILHGDFSNKQDEEIQHIRELLRQFRRGELHVPVFSGSPSVATKINAQAGTRKLIFLIPKSLSHSKARTKLAWLLQEPLSPVELARMLRQDIAGECFEVPVLPDWIAGESYGPNNHLDRRIAKRVVIVFPGIEPAVYAEAVDSLINAKAKKSELNIIGFGDGNIPLASMTVAEKVSEYVAERYKLVVGFPPTSSYLDVEFELTAFLRYNAELRKIVAAKYAIADQWLMMRELLNWCVSEEKKAERLRVDHKVSTLVRTLAAELGINERTALKVVEDDRGSLRPLLLVLKDGAPETQALEKLPDILSSRGLSTEGLPPKAPPGEANVGGYWVRNQGSWLATIEADTQQRSLLVKELAHVYARRIMKDALAACHPVLGMIVRCVDAGVKVNIQSNAEMARTDARRYELGNFLLVAGADSANAPGWPAGPLRLIVG